MKKRILFLLSLSLTSCVSFKTNSINVILEKNKAFTTQDSYVKKVRPGEDVSFKIDFKLEYEFDSVNHGTYKDGTITVKNIYSPTRVVVTSKSSNIYRVKIKNDDSKGNITETSYIVKRGESIPLNVVAGSSYDFTGWTLSSSLKDGGELLSVNSKFNYFPRKSCTIYTNYVNKGVQKIVTYHANGGSALDGSDTTSFSHVVPKFSNIVKFPNTIIGTDMFKKEGHTLYSWNTKADGTGKDYGLGSRLDSMDSIELYAKWIEWSDPSKFTTELNEEGALDITGCSDHSDTVVVPEFINETKVTTIKADAFNSLEMSKIVLPKSITSIEDEAFNSCSNLTTFCMFDAIKKISDDIFLNTENVETIRINAVIPPRYVKGSDGFTANVFDYMRQMQGKKIIFFGGSTLYYGLNAETFLSRSNGIDFVEFGANMSVGMRFLAEIALHFANADDYFIGGVTYHTEGVGGTNSFHEICFQALEANYDMLTLVKYNQFSNVFKCFASFNNTREASLPFDYVALYKNKDSRGLRCDLKIYDPTIVFDNSPREIESSIFGTDSDIYFGDLDTRCIAKGVHYYMVGSPYNSNVTFSQEFKDKWNEVYPRTLGECDSFLYPMNYFYNGRYHLTTEGSKVFTNDVCDKLNDLGAFNS